MIYFDWLIMIFHHQKKSDPRNAKEPYQSFIRKKNTKSVKQSKIMTQQPKTFENQNIVDIKSKSM